MEKMSGANLVEAMAGLIALFSFALEDGWLARDRKDACPRCGGRPTDRLYEDEHGHRVVKYTGGIIVGHVQHTSRSGKPWFESAQYACSCPAGRQRKGLMRFDDKFPEMAGATQYESDRGMNIALYGERWVLEMEMAAEECMGRAVELAREVRGGAPATPPEQVDSGSPDGGAGQPPL